MTSRDFCYWLQGYMELSEAKCITGVGFTPEQRSKIEAHLNLVFKHEIDPSMGDAAHQAELNAVHNGGSIVKPAHHRPPGDKPVMRC